MGKKKRTTLIEIKEKQLEGKNAENSISGRRKKKTFLDIYFSKLQQPIRLCHICCF